MPTHQENRGQLGIDPERGHIAFTGTNTFEQLMAQFEAFALMQSAELGVAPKEVTMVDYLKFLKQNTTTATE